MTERASASDRTFAPSCIRNSGELLVRGQVHNLITGELPIALQGCSRVAVEIVQEDNTDGIALAVSLTFFVAVVLDCDSGIVGPGAVTPYDAPSWSIPPTDRSTG